MSDMLPEGWTQDAIDDEYRRQTESGQTIEAWEASLPRCPRRDAPVKPYHFRIEHGGAVWHERCHWATNHGMPDGVA